MSKRRRSIARWKYFESRCCRPHQLEDERLEDEADGLEPTHDAAMHIRAALLLGIFGERHDGADQHRAQATGQWMLERHAVLLRHPLHANRVNQVADETQGA